MKKLITFFVNLNLGAKTNNFLHIVVGILIATAIHFLIEAIPLTDPIEWYGLLIFKLIITLLITWLGGVRWEQMQVNDFGAKYSKADIARGVIGGVVAVLILSLFL
jgi:hypothetical protein